MADTWDQMLADADVAMIAEIKSDMATYTSRFVAGNTAGCVEIEKKYGLYGLSPQHVTETLHEMTLPMNGGAA